MLVVLFVLMLFFVLVELLAMLRCCFNSSIICSLSALRVLMRREVIVGGSPKELRTASMGSAYYEMWRVVKYLLDDLYHSIASEIERLLERSWSLWGKGRGPTE